MRYWESTAPCVKLLFKKRCYYRKFEKEFVSLLQRIKAIMKTLPEYITLLHSYMQQNASKYGILRMGIFGSVARNEHTPTSDVDIYVEGKLHGFFALAGIKQELEELLDCKVDIVRLRDKMDSFLREKIQKEGIYV